MRNFVLSLTKFWVHASNSAVVWMMDNTDTKLVCAVGSRPPINIQSQLYVLDFAAKTSQWPRAELTEV